MSRIKVLHLHTLPVISGSGINTFLTMKGTHGDRFEVSLACAPGKGLNDTVRDAGMAVHEVDHLVQPLSMRKDIKALMEIIEILGREKIDIIHTHNSKAGFLGRLAGRLAGVPAVVHTVHGFAFHNAESPYRRLLYRTLERMASPWADHTIFISQPMIDWARKEKIIKHGLYSKIYSGIDLQAFERFGDKESGELRSELGLQSNDRVIGFVSKLWEGKGHDVALRALVPIVDVMPSAKLLLVGEGPLEEKLRKQCRRLGIEASVIFAGFRTRIAEITSLCSLCILPSFFEGMGRVLLEAGACGRPVVASNVGGIPDVVEDGVTGFLVPPGDDLSLSKAILRLLGDPELSRNMGRAAQKRMSDKFDARTMVSKIVSVYDTCLHREGRIVPPVKGTTFLERAMRKRKAG